jgi:DNA-directed RNA polymerase specialized sigma24 family protein
MGDHNRKWLQHYRSLVAAARRHAGGPGEAEDLVQEALLAALLVDRPVDALPANLAWLAGVIRN